MLDFIQKNFQLTMPVGAGPRFWMTDFPTAPGYPDAENLPLPSWMPQKVYIVHARIRTEQTSPGQWVASIDHERNAYNTGSPPFHQAGSFPGGLGDFSKCEALVSLVAGTQEVKDNFWPPKLLDRAIDSIWIQNDSAAGMFSLDLGFLVPVTEQPSAVGWPSPGAPPPPPSNGWTTIIGPVSFDVDSDYTGYTWSLSIDPSAIASAPANNSMRVTIQSGASAGVMLDKLLIGPRGAGQHIATALTPVTIVPLAAAAGGQVVVSLPQGFDFSNGAIIRGYVSSGKLRARTSALAGFHVAYKQGDVAATLDGSSFTAGGSAVAVAKVEVS